MVTAEEMAGGDVVASEEDAAPEKELSDVFADSSPRSILPLSGAL